MPAVWLLGLPCVVLCFKLYFPWDGGAECGGCGEWLILPSQMVIRAFTAFPSQRDACVQLSTACSIKNSNRAGPRMAQRLEVLWQITVPVTGLPAASDNGELILPLQRIRNDSVPCRTSSNPHKSHVYIMKLSLTQPIKKISLPRIPWVSVLSVTLCSLLCTALTGWRGRFDFLWMVNGEGHNVIRSWCQPNEWNTSLMYCFKPKKRDTISVWLPGINRLLLTKSSFPRAMNNPCKLGLK